MLITDFAIQNLPLSGINPAKAANRANFSFEKFGLITKLFKRLKNVLAVLSISDDKTKQKEPGGNDFWKPRFPVAELPVIKPEQAPDGVTERGQGDEPQEGIMKKMSELFCPRRQGDEDLKILKGGGAMFRKLVNTAMLAVLLLTASSLSKPAYAGGSSSAYIVLTCTVTLSVSLTGATTWFNLGNVSAGTTVYSNNGVTVRNDSQGAICTWALNIDPVSLNGWTLANSAGLNQTAIYGVFQSTQNAANYSTIFSTTAQTYNASTGVFSCGSYSSPQAGYGVESRIAPAALNGVGTYSSDRNLWIKMLTPLAVTDQNQRSIGIVVTASMAG